MGQSWTLGKTFNSPEKHCCSCGGGGNAVSQAEAAAMTAAATAPKAAAQAAPASTGAPVSSSPSAAGCFKHRWDTVPGLVLFADTTEHGCSTAHGQCYWPDIPTAQTECAKWAECEALFCSEKFNNGPYACYARKNGKWATAAGDSGYEKVACSELEKTEKTEGTAPKAQPAAVAAPEAAICWEKQENMSPGPDLLETGTAHGCSTAYEQCFWTSVEQAQKECAAWGACEALFCTKKFNMGPYVCYARKHQNAMTESSGDTAWTKKPCPAAAPPAAPVAKAAPPAAKTAPVASGTCQDTTGWTNLAAACKEQGHTEEKGCMTQGWGCKGYEEFWCRSGQAIKGFEWTLGARFNEPEKNCCECGKGGVKSGGAGPTVQVAQASATQATTIKSCKDTADWYNGFKECHKHGYSESDGCIAQKGFTCSQYKKAGWCADGKTAPGQEWTSGPGFMMPESHCCVCGGGTLL